MIPRIFTQKHEKLEFHPWMKIFYPWIFSSMEKMMDDSFICECHPSQPAGVRLTIKKGTPKIPSKSIFPHPNRYEFRQSATVNFF